MTTGPITRFRAPCNAINGKTLNVIVQMQSQMNNDRALATGNAVGKLRSRNRPRAILNRRRQITGFLGRVARQGERLGDQGPGPPEGR